MVHNVIYLEYGTNQTEVKHNSFSLVVVVMILQVWFSNRRAKGRRKPYEGGTTAPMQVTSPLVCTCHKYSVPLLTPWMIESGPSRLFFPPTGYWGYESS